MENSSMNVIDSRWVFSPRDLISELECEQRLNLDWAVENDLIKSPGSEFSDELDLLIKQGELHEARLVEKLRAQGSFREIGKPVFTDESLNSALQQTLKAMADGIDTIWQATLYTKTFIGFADFLIRVKDDAGNPITDSDGRFIYDPVDAKSARTAKRSAVLQVAAYAHALVSLGLPAPHKIHLRLGGEQHWQALSTDLLDLVDDYLHRLNLKKESFSKPTEPLWAAPRESCMRCRWQQMCEDGRVRDRDLSLVQEIRSTTRVALIESGIKTIDQLAIASDEQRPKGAKEVSLQTFENLRAQANLQIRGEVELKPIYEVRDINRLGLLPNSDPGDVWFDMEGDPFANSGSGLEYMFGIAFLDNSELKFKTFNAKNIMEEKQAFADFIEFVLERLRSNPGMHIYHYAQYEVTAMFKLSLRHGIYEDVIDNLIRSGVFVDLYSIVRNTFRFSTPSLSIKDVEGIYQDKRDKSVGVNTAVNSVIQFELALTKLENNDQSGFDEILDQIKKYNQDDCFSTYNIDRWIRAEAQILGAGIGYLQLDADAVVDGQIQIEGTLKSVVEAISAHTLEDPAKRTNEQSALSLLAAAILFYRREVRPAWHAIFERAKTPIDEFEKFNDVIPVSKAQSTMWEVPPGKRNYRRTITITATDLEISHILDIDQTPQALYEIAPVGFKRLNESTRGFKDVKIVAINGDEIIIEESIKRDTWDHTPIALLPPKPYGTKQMEDVLVELGKLVLQNLEAGLAAFSPSAWTDLLLRNPPRQKSGGLKHGGEKLDDIVTSLKDSDNSYVAVQGPPGTGKTYLGVRVIAKLAEAGWKIGVVAQSHAVIEKLLDDLHKLNPNIAIGKKGQFENSTKPYHTPDLSSWMYEQKNGFVVGGTIWSFSNPATRTAKLDLMVIDEAGQFSLANSLVALSCADRGLFLGDPQQLPQVSQANHPEPVEVSVLAHILGRLPTIPDHLGYFLETTYRMHPLLAKPVSILQYEGKLHSADHCAKRVLVDVAPGLQIINVEHSGNTTRSKEEVDVLIPMIPKIIGKDWIDFKDGKALPARALSESDILIVTAYNMQVRYIKSRLAVAGYKKIKVGTFDKFQGQEAPIVFVSMATSSSEDLPRGIDFLLSPNRLNVAISRAQWACYLLRSPKLSTMQPTSADGMVVLGKFISLCRNVSNVS